MKKLFIILLTLILLLCSFGLIGCDIFSRRTCKHENTQKSTTVEATCTQTGIEKTICTDCEEVLEEKTLSKLSHTASDWIVDTNATCEEEGSKHKECTICEEVLETETIEKTWHNFVNGECEYCGDNEANYITEGLEFALINNDTEYSVTDYTGTSTEVYIPSTYQGKAVTSIGYRAFNGCASLTSIVIPNSVTSIGYQAFYGCDSLIIYCEANEKPSGWATNWNYDNRPVEWGYNGNN